MPAALEQLGPAWQWGAFVVVSGSLLPAILFCLVVCTTCQTTGKNDGFRKEISSDFEADFLNPPSYARLRAFWWWLNSNVTEDCITKDLEAMKANGYGGAIIFDAGSSNYSVALKTEPGPAFLSDKWMELYKHAIREADRLGLELTINVQSGWNPGGPSVTPEYAMKTITWSEKNVTGPGKITDSLPEPPSKLYYKDILVQEMVLQKVSMHPYSVHQYLLHRCNEEMSAEMAKKGLSE